MNTEAEPEGLVGEIVAGRYRIEALLGHGAMGTVYRARHIGMGRAFAIKVLHPRLVSDDKVMRRFAREAELAGSLAHPNVVSVVDVGEAANGMHYLVMEYAEGRTLYELITSAAPMPRQRVIEILRKLCAGLEHAHDRGLIHRDFKPENVIVERTTDGTDTPRIVDFGVSILLEDASASGEGRLTSAGLVLGTPHYMAPEHATGASIDHRIDIFALGVICYEMLTGAPPYDGDGVEVARANLMKPTPIMALRVPGLRVDPLLEALTRKLMAKSRDDRPASARAVIDLIDLIEDDPQGANLALGVTKTLERFGLPRRTAPRAAARPTPSPRLTTEPTPALFTDQMPRLHTDPIPRLLIDQPHELPRLRSEPVRSEQALRPTEPATSPALGSMQVPRPETSSIPVWHAGLQLPYAKSETLKVSRSRHTGRIFAAAGALALIAAMIFALHTSPTSPQPAPLATAAPADPSRTSPSTLEQPAAPAAAASSEAPAAATEPAALTTAPAAAAIATPVAPPAPPAAAAHRRATSRFAVPSTASTRRAAKPTESPAAIDSTAAPASGGDRELMITQPIAPSVNPPPPANLPPTSATVAQLYATVGKQLKQLDQVRGSAATADLWPVYLRIRINDVISDDIKCREADALLHRMYNQIEIRFH